MLGYFEPSFFLCVWSEGYSNWDALLILDFGMSKEELLLGRVFFAQLAWAGIYGPRVSSDRIVLRRAQGPANLLFWAGLHNSPSKLRF